MQLRFLGAAQEVTGSCFLLEVGRSRVLIDCGLHQGDPATEARNREPFPFPPGAIDAVVLTHAHLDHSGRIPLLVKAGFRGPVYAHRACRDLCRIMLLDAAHLNEKDTEHENRKRARKGLRPLEPLYTRRDAERAMRQFRALDYGVKQQILPGVQVVLHDAGHILGSAIVGLTVEERGLKRRIVFSGDLGHAGAPILHDPETLKSGDLVVLESTYGDRAHRSWQQTWAELAAVFREAELAEGNILIPAFAVGRSQELLYVFRRNSREWGLDRWAIFLDSPMAIEATEVYARHWKLYNADAARQRRRNVESATAPDLVAGRTSAASRDTGSARGPRLDPIGDAFRMPNLHFTRTAAQSAAINRIQSGAVILAGSGMCDGGRIRHHLKHNVWREHCHIVFVGFQARGTLGRLLVDGVKHIRLWGESMRVAATVHTIGGLSAHADQNGLTQWYRHFRGRPPVALVHGEPAAMTALAERLGREYRAQVHRPQPGAAMDLATLELA